MRKPKNIDSLIATNLRKARHNQKMTLIMAASDIGIAYQQLQKYENGTNRISASRLWQLALIYNVPIQDFFE